MDPGACLAFGAAWPFPAFLLAGCRSGGDTHQRDSGAGNVCRRAGAVYSCGGHLTTAGPIGALAGPYAGEDLGDAEYAPSPHHQRTHAVCRGAQLPESKELVELFRRDWPYSCATGRLSRRNPACVGAGTADTPATRRRRSETYGRYARARTDRLVELGHAVETLGLSRRTLLRAKPGARPGRHVYESQNMGEGLATYRANAGASGIRSPLSSGIWSSDARRFCVLVGMRKDTRKDALPIARGGDRRSRGRRVARVCPTGHPAAYPTLRTSRGRSLAPLVRCVYHRSAARLRTLPRASVQASGLQSARMDICRHSGQRVHPGTLAP